ELSDNFIENPMDVIKVGDIKEFVIIDLDKDRRRIGLSLKSDAMSRIGQGGVSGKRPSGSTASDGNRQNSKNGNGGRKVVVVKKNSVQGLNKGYNNSNNEKSAKKYESYDSGDSYNPFAGL
ncbi:MAG: S1 RNA-binding domain-containing protein, partial [Treponema sp.]|nr:S1 RNA-binding domain-containing protein [Treponema sp.]